MRLNLPPHVDPKHPVLLQEYAVFTPPVAEMAAKLGDWIEQQQPGGYIHGPSRFGKSRGVKWHLRKILNERFAATLPLYIWVRPPDSHASEAGFWKSWMIAVNHRFAQTVRGASEWRTVFQEFLISAALSAGSTLIVLVVDEAQDMTVREWKWLLGLQNALDWEGFRLSVFSVASHQMGYQYELMGHADHAHVAARFMVAHWPFPGLCSQEELAFVLQGYDTDSEWPQASGVSYLAHFAPLAHARGERLADSAGVFWRVLEAMLPNHYRGAPMFPMQHVARTVEEILRRLARRDDWEEVVSRNSWLDVLALTHFDDHMRLISASMPATRRQATT